MKQTGKEARRYLVAQTTRREAINISERIVRGNVAPDLAPLTNKDKQHTLQRRVALAVTRDKLTNEHTRD